MGCRFEVLIKFENFTCSRRGYFAEDCDWRLCTRVVEGFGNFASRKDRRRWMERVDPAARSYMVHHLLSFETSDRPHDNLVPEPRGGRVASTYAEWSGSKMFDIWDMSILQGRRRAERQKSIE